MNKVYTFNFTGTVQTLTVPNKYTSIVIDAYGAQGGNLNTWSMGWIYGGNGGRAYGKYTFKPTDSRVLSIYVGGQNAWNGGGAGGSTCGNGGGASDIRINGTAMANRIIVAGGGGGAGWGTAGGIGGGLTGGNGGATTGGTQTGGGSGSTGVGSFGYGGNNGGGAGWYGGGGTSGNPNSGGGGSSYINLLDTSTRLTTAGVRGANGAIVITLISPDKFLLKRGSEYYSILPSYYDEANTHNFIPLTLQGGDHPNAADIANFGFDNPSQLTTSITKGSDTFIPFDKLKALGGVFDLRYYYYNGSAV